MKPEQTFAKLIRISMDKYYRQKLSEHVRRGLLAKKLSTRKQLPCKQ